MNLKLTLFFAVSLAVVGAIAAPQLASACGTPSEAEMDRMSIDDVVVNHLNAVRKGDAKKLTGLWSANPGASVIRLSRSGKQVVSMTPINNSIAKWASTPDKQMKWTVKSTRVKGNSATVELAITWHGATLAEQLTLRKKKGVWALAGKRFRIMKAAVVAKRKTFGGGY